MMISSTGMSSASTYSYQLNIDSDANSVQGQQGGPPPPPQGGPQVDTDGSNTWDLDELEELSASLSEEDGDSFDAEAVLSSYDTNENGVIDADEMSAVEEDDAFNLSNMQSVMAEKAEGTMPPPPPEEDAISALSSDDEDEAKMLEETLKKLQEAREAAAKAAEEAEEEEDEDDDEFEKLTMRLLSKASDAYALQSTYANYLQGTAYEADAI